MPLYIRFQRNDWLIALALGEFKKSDQLYWHSPPDDLVHLGKTWHKWSIKCFNILFLIETVIAFPSFI